MEPHLFAGALVSDLPSAVTWWSRLLGSEPVMYPDETEAVWELAEGRCVYVEQRPGGTAGGALVTVFVGDVAAFLERVTAAGLTPDTDETYDNGVRKLTFHDPDGNEVGVGGQT